MWKDEIVEEVHRVREAYAAKFNYDLDAMVRDIQERERLSGRKVIAPPPKRPQPLLAVEESREEAPRKAA